LALLADATDGEFLTTDFVPKFGVGIDGFGAEDAGVAANVCHTVNFESCPNDVIQSGRFLCRIHMLPDIIPHPYKKSRGKLAVCWDGAFPLVSRGNLLARTLDDEATTAEDLMQKVFLGCNLFGIEITKEGAAIAKVAVCLGVRTLKTVSSALARDG